MNGGVADDDIGPGPVRRLAIGREQRISDEGVPIEVVQRQRLLGDVKLVNGQLARDHHGDLGDFDGERVDVQAVEVLGAEETEADLARLGTAGELGVNALVNAGFEALEGAVGDVEEVAAAAGGIEHAEMVEAVQELVQPGEGLRALDLLGPGRDDRRLDDLHDFDGAGEVDAEGAALVH
jgi:hypothetical protein